MAGDAPLLSVELRVDYPNKPQTLRAVSFQVSRGEVLGLVGESGSGKSTIALAILRLLGLKGGRVSGNIWFHGRDLMMVSPREMRRIRGREIGLVLQSPLSSLNPALRIGTQLAEAWKAHATEIKGEQTAALSRILDSVGLPADREFCSRYPRQISVGQAQRVVIAMAVMHSPALLIADEPTSALDAITQSEIIKLFTELQHKMGSAVLYISHDLLSVSSLCNRIAILHDGEIVECGYMEQVLSRPTHPYTQQLLSRFPWPMRFEVPARQSSYVLGKTMASRFFPILDKRDDRKSVPDSR
jgi:ABC-type dipeptide/oligopeptide/nickel transport system ATPase component